MNRRDIVIGVVILAALSAVVFFWRRPEIDEELKVPQTLSVEDAIEDAFNLEIPEDVEKAEMRDVSGGDASAIATRKFENGRFELNVLADLPDGSYTSELKKDGETKPLGSLRIAKGGYLLEFRGFEDLSDYSTVKVISGEETILEGRF